MLQYICIILSLLSSHKTLEWAAFYSSSQSKWHNYLSPKKNDNKKICILMKLLIPSFHLVFVNHIEFIFFSPVEKGIHIYRCNHKRVLFLFSFFIIYLYMPPGRVDIYFLKINVLLLEFNRLLFINPAYLCSKMYIIWVNTCIYYENEVSLRSNYLNRILSLI